MKYLVLLLLLTPLVVLSKTLTYQILKSGAHGKYDEYIAKDGVKYKIGDTIYFGVPAGANGQFLYVNIISIAGTVSYANQNTTGTYAIIKKIRAFGNPRMGYKVSFQTKGTNSFENYVFALEESVEAGEVINNGVTSHNAMEALKRAKEKLDLELITREQYQHIKDSLSKHIK